MRTALVAALAALPLVLSVAPAAAQDADTPTGIVAPAQPQPTTTTPSPAANVDGPPSAAEPDAAPPAHESRDARESREERERWRLPSDLVNPFIDDPRGTDDDVGLRARRQRDRELGAWFIADDDVVDPWGMEPVGPLYGVRCRGRFCRADRERAIYLRAPATAHRARRRRARRVELAALVSASTVGSNARARLEVQAAVHRGALGLGFSLSTSSGEVRVGTANVTHPRHALALIVEHRLTDGTVFLDLGAAAGLMISELEDAELTPTARVMLTAGIPLVRNVEVLVRADALTTFVRPGGHADAGPSAFEFGMGIGLRISTP